MIVQGLGFIRRHSVFVNTVYLLLEINTSYPWFHHMNSSCCCIDKRPVYFLVVVLDCDEVLFAAVLTYLKAADLWVFELYHSNKLHNKVD